jgi:hypothetical protein
MRKEHYHMPSRLVVLYDFIWIGIGLFYLLQNCIQLTDYLVIRAFGSMRGIYQDT